ncbi:hypothetical protein ACLOJK_039608 [Asimina triloba]
MEPACDFCGAKRAFVYCQSDTARLCPECDGYIHAANALSRRHLRSLICDRCSSQPAVVRCLEEKLSLCPTCDCNNSHAAATATTTTTTTRPTTTRHRQETINCYSGCPSVADVSKFCSSYMDVDGSWGSGILNGKSEGWEQQGEDGTSVGSMTEFNELDGCVKLEPWMESSSMLPPPNSKDVPCIANQNVVPKEETVSQLGCSPIKESEDICRGLNINDVNLNFGENDEIFGCSLSHSRELFESIGMDCSFMDNNFAVTDSNVPNVNSSEASSMGQDDYMAPQSSHALGPMLQPATSNTDVSSLVNPHCNRNININLSFPAGHSHMSLSVSNITGESYVTDYQDCGVSPIFIKTETPWDSNIESGCPQARHKAKMRYNEKKKHRSADTRKRVKGRFVKSGEPYDYDPLEDNK